MQDPRLNPHAHDLTLSDHPWNEPTIAPLNREARREAERQRRRQAKRRKR